MIKTRIREEDLERLKNKNSNRGVKLQNSSCPVFNNLGQLVGIVSGYNRESQTFRVVSTPLIKEKIIELEKQ